jgi:hypothetical protein
MAQGAVALVPSNGATLTAEEIHEILECEKIVRFRDAVLSGTHPRIKVPPHLNGKSATRHTSTPTSLTPRPNLPSSQVEPKAITPGTHVEDNHNLSNNRSSITPRMAPGRSGGSMPMLAKAEINPILLEKSDDLIKAEIQLQRVRLERVLREQVEQRRVSLKALAQTSESLPDFDISDVLSKALSIVHPSTATEAEQPVGDHASASDSFDENTFYSSQHDTPEQSISSQELRERGETSARGIALTAAHPENALLNKDHYEPVEEVMTDVPLSKNVPSADQELVHQLSPMLQYPKLGASYHTSSSGLKKTATDTAPQGQTDGAYDEDIARAASGSIQQVQEATVSTHSDIKSRLSSMTLEYFTDLGAKQTGASLKRKFAETDSSASAEILEPAIIRNLEDVPTLAPQPARVSPLVTARAPPVIGQSMIADEATPAQVAALRKPSAASSPDSSPKENKTADKKKSKKKKRKSSGKQPGTADAPDSPYIKPEPRSPSPYAVAPLPRPLQRQRQTVQQGPELNYDEPRYEVPREEPREQTVNSRFKEHGPRSVHDRAEVERIYEPREAEIYGYRRVGRDGKQYNRVVSQEVYRAPTSPIMPAGPFSSHEPRSVRAASHTITDRHLQEAPRYYRDLPPRATVRLHADRERSRSPIMRDRRSPILMAPPPRLPPARIVIDDYGQQYYAPAPVPVSSRRSVAPASRPGDEDLIYERTSVRPVPRPVPDLYEEDGVVYRRSSPPLTTSRRVISQADLDVDYRSYRQREYSSRPIVLAPPPDEYVRIREPLETRQPEYALETPAGYAPLGYAPRARSVRPEATRDEVPREYVTRVQSVRPELPPKDYASSVRPETIRGDAAPREYVTRLQSARPEALNPDYNTASMRREPIREGVPREYIARVQSVRPEQIPQEYGGSARHEPRREIVGQSHREFSVRPGDTEIVRREYIPPADSVYAPTTRLVSRRVIDEADYIERPRDGTHDVYMDDGRRDVMYR